MLTSKQIVQEIKSAKNIAIFAHKNPDPDAYGSMFGMREICNALGKNTDIFAVKNRDGYLDYLFPLKDIKTDFFAKNYDLVFLLDMHLTSRAENIFQDEILKSKNIIIIDHHNVAENDIFPTQKFLIKHDYAANCEILTEIVVKESIDVSQKLATYLYIGLMGDTNRFLNSNTSHHVFETALFLMKKKADIQRVYDFLYRYRTKEEIEVNKFLLDNLCYECNGKAVYSIFTLKDIKKLNADQEDIKTFSNDLIIIKDVELSFMCMEYSKNYYKISIRSQKDINTLSVAEKQGGGGHKNASGFEIFTTKLGLKRKIKEWAKELLHV